MNTKYPMPIGRPRPLHKRVFGRAAVMQLFENDGTHSDFLFFEVRKRSSIILGLTNNYEVISLSQFRYAQNRVMLELPGGYFMKGDTPERCAHREFSDETGYIPESVVPLGGIILYEPSYMKGGYFPFLFLNCRKVSGQNLETDEHIRVKLVPFEKWVKRVSTDNVRGGPMLVTTLLALRHLS